MLWYKSWLETRSRFFFGLALLMVVAAGTVFDYPAVVKLMPMAQGVDVGGQLGRAIRESVQISSTYRGHVWVSWFRQNLSQMGTLFAALLGSGGLLSQAAGGAALFTLSLPVSRNRVLGIRAATGLAELVVLAFVPSLLIPLLSPAVGESYSLASVLIHGLCFFAAVAAFFCLALLLSTVFADIWRPLLITCSIAIVLSGCEAVVREFQPYGIFRLMSAERYFEGGGVPWVGLLLSSAVSAGLIYVAAGNLARKDF
jgi:hypothetical protein